MVVRFTRARIEVHSGEDRIRSSARWNIQIIIKVETDSQPGILSVKSKERVGDKKIRKKSIPQKKKKEK